MSEWDRKYHIQTKPKLKAALITIAVVAATFVGITVAERISYAMTFPGSSESVEIGGDTFYLKINDDSLYGTIWKITLATDTNENDQFPSGINATRVWFIPIRGRIWSWRDYKIFPLIYNNHSTPTPSQSSYYVSQLTIVPKVSTHDTIVEVNASGVFFYLNKEGLDI